MQIMVVSYTIWQIGKVFPPFWKRESGSVVFLHLLQSLLIFSKKDYL